MPDVITSTIGGALSLLRGLGPPPIGSPPDMRMHAVRLRAVAEGLAPAQTLLALAGRLEGGEGPAADTGRAALTHEQQVLDGRVHAIRELAARIDSEAIALENAQAAWRRGLAARTVGVAETLVSQALRRLGWRLP